MLGRFLAMIVTAVIAAGCGAVVARPRTAPGGGGAPRSKSTSNALTPGRSSRHADYIVPVVAIQLVTPLTQYTAYVETLLRRLPRQIAALRAGASGGDRTDAEEAWVRAHATWLDLGQDDDAYGAFGELGERIDGLADGLPRTTGNAGFTGFHKVELDLWRRDDLAAAAADAAHLGVLVAELTPARIRADLPLKTVDLDSWVLRCHEILEDALRDSLSQDDDYGSNTELASLSADINATREMLKVLGPLISSRAPSIVPRATAELRALEAAIAAAGGPGARRNLERMPVRLRQALDAATGAAVETLAPISEILQVTVPGA